jgi:hypothetical protein
MSANPSRRRFIMAAAAGALMGNARICSGLPVPDPLQSLVQKITGDGTAGAPPPPVIVTETACLDAT